MRHRLLIGGDWAELDADLSNRLLAPEERGGIVPGLSLIDPVYGQTSGAAYGLDQFPASLRSLSFERYGLYLQDQIDLNDRWNVLLGLRWDEFDDANVTSGDRFSDSGYSYRIGTSYALSDCVRAYAVHATGFVPQDPGSQDPLTPNWALNFSYAYNDTRVTEATGSITNAVGRRFVNAPEHQAGLWTRYDFDSINSAIAGGFDYVDERISFNNQKVRSYVVFDLSWQTRINNWLLQANIKNLFDKTYAQSGFLSRTGHFPGEPRRFYLLATLDF